MSRFLSKYIGIGKSVCAALCFLGVTNQACAHSKNDPEVVTQVDLNRYAGLWYEVAHSPNFFQGGCLYSTAEYSVLNDTSISVHNICYKANSITDIEGVAKITNLSEPAKLRVRFNFFLRGDYWITDLDPDYQWAIVSGPGKKSIFILARQAPPSEDLVNELVLRLKNKGFRVDNLIFDKY